MLAVVANAFCCQLPLSLTTMPRVVPDQREKFENDELFRKLSRESEVRYTGYRDRPLSERQQRFYEDCRNGHADVAFVGSGTNFQLSFLCNPWSEHTEDKRPTEEYVNFNKEPGKFCHEELIVQSPSGSSVLGSGVKGQVADQWSMLILLLTSWTPGTSHSVRSARGPSPTHTRHSGCPQIRGHLHLQIKRPLSVDLFVSGADSVIVPGLSSALLVLAATMDPSAITQPSLVDAPDSKLI
ncbi:hypothetical protein LSH36_61g04013 [Paralvinella palmiformis]|uniref:Uncharacterized protein n=1 Tax=Paralvinella palmiformis TaxID=53620 RepID=A0AAD9K466_9ANNE|nr:hypothetical protein LSH36_61g04013 [Paralvinella palmiformis]